MNLLTTAQVADRLNANADTLKRMCQAGRIEGAVKIAGRWLIDAKQIEKIQVAPRGWPQGKARK